MPREKDTYRIESRATRTSPQLVVDVPEDAFQGLFREGIEIDGAVIEVPVNRKHGLAQHEIMCFASTTTTIDSHI